MHAAPTRLARPREHDRAGRHRELRFLERFLSLRTRFLEVGAGDCTLAFEACDLAEHVVAVEVCDRTCGTQRPCNFELVLSDGRSVPVPARSIDVAFSNQTIERLQPQDAREQIASIFRALVPGGTYVCITAKSGYSARALREMLFAAGFARIDFYFEAFGGFARCPGSLLSLLESLLGSIPVRVAAIKPGGPS